MPVLFVYDLHIQHMKIQLEYVHSLESLVAWGYLLFLVDTEHQEIGESLCGLCLGSEFDQ